MFISQWDVAIIPLSHRLNIAFKTTISLLVASQEDGNPHVRREILQSSCKPEIHDTQHVDPRVIFCFFILHTEPVNIKYAHTHCQKPVVSDEALTY